MAVSPAGALSEIRDRAAFAALRTLLSVPQALGLSMSTEAARLAGRLVAQNPANRKRLERAKGHLRFALRGADEATVSRYASAAYEHLFMLGVEFMTAPRLITDHAWDRHVDISGLHVPGTGNGLACLLQRWRDGGHPVILVTGHCGNWEVLGYTMAALGFPTHALYRPLDFKPLDRWMREMRSRRGLELLDKFGAARSLPALLEKREPVAFVADQNAGDRGQFVPFFGRLASTYKSVAVLAARYRAIVACGHARRLTPAEMTPEEQQVCRGMRYRIEIADVITPEDYLEQPDPPFYVAARYRRAIERMVLSAPDQYLWMHRAWKSRPRHEVEDAPFPDWLKDKLLALPWLDGAGVDGIIEQSERDREQLRGLAVKRL